MGVTLKTYDKDVIGEDYRSLIELAFKKCDKFALVIQKGLFINDEWAMKFYNKNLGDIESSLIEMKEQSEWAVTITEGTANVYYYELNKQTKQFLQTKSNSLFGWIKGLPEDLMFFSGHKVWLAVNSHEEYFFLNKELDSDGELESLLKRLFS